MFYAQFATKRQVFIESFNVFVRWTSELIEPPLADEPDPAVHLVMRMYAYWGLQRLSPDLLGLARAEALQEDAETRAAVQEALRLITSGPTRDFASLRRASADPPVSDELMAYSMFGATEEIVMRASWDDAYSLARHHGRAPVHVPRCRGGVHRARTTSPRGSSRYGELIDRLIERVHQCRARAIRPKRSGETPPRRLRLTPQPPRATPSRALFQPR